MAIIEDCVPFDIEGKRLGIYLRLDTDKSERFVYFRHNTHVLTADHIEKLAQAMREIEKG